MRRNAQTEANAATLQMTRDHVNRTLVSPSARPHLYMRADANAVSASTALSTDRHDARICRTEGLLDARVCKAIPFDFIWVLRLQRADTVRLVVE